MIESGAWAALALGFLLGLKHATDADHVVAVTTAVAEQANAWRSIWVGVSWGLGHTTPLLVLGSVVLVLKEAVLDRYAALAPALEFGVGVMLVFLGAQVFYNLRRGKLHVHSHRHDGQAHVHIHATHRSGEEPAREALHGFWKPGRPAFRTKSYAMGVVHGLAGSAAVMLVLLPQIDAVWVGAGYLALFGLGTIVSMGMLTVALGVPFAVTSRAQGLNRMVAGAAGGVSLLFGAALMSDTALGTALIPL